MGEDPRLAPVPLRERQVWRLAALGETNEEIAARLALSPYTVHGKLTRLFRRFNLRNRVEATLLALEVGLVTQADVVQVVGMVERRKGRTYAEE